MYKPIVIFDFCETLVDFQTADAFAEFVYTRKKRIPQIIRNTIVKIIDKTRVLDIAEIITGWKYSLHKKSKLWIIKGVSEKDLEALSVIYYQERIKPHLVRETVEILQNYIIKGYNVIIVSGGYDIYLKHFAEEFCVSTIISTRIGFSHGKCNGKIDGIDCLNDNKVRLFKTTFGENAVFDVEASYSDSISDIPILSIAKNGFVVSRKHQEWANSNNFNEIIWNYVSE